MTWSEVYSDLAETLGPIVEASSKAAAVMPLSNGGRIDFWSLENQIAGRGRRYQRIVIDEAAFAKDGDNRTDASMMALWENLSSRRSLTMAARRWSARFCGQEPG